MQSMMANALETWASFYSNHAALRTATGFAHVGGLMLGGGCAIFADRQTIRAAREPEPERRSALLGLRRTHATVLYSLIAITASGLLLFAADSESFWHSTFFWIKMGLFVLLIANGSLLLRAEESAVRGEERGWKRLINASIASMVLWFLITLAGAALPNIG